MKNWRKDWIGWTLALAFAVLPVRSGAQGSLPPEVADYGYADMVVVNGKVISMDDAGYNLNVGNIYQAMAIKGERIIALGTSQRIRAMAGPKTKVIDLLGQTIIPGIVETHAHIYGDAGLAEQMGLRTPDKGTNVRVMAKKDMETTRMLVEDAIKSEIKKMPAGDWLRVYIMPNKPEGLSASEVFGWTAQGQIEDRKRLDSLGTPNNPVMVLHSTKASLNSAAWKVMGEHFPDLDDYYKTAMADVHNSFEKGVVSVEAMQAIQWDIWWKKAPTSLLADILRRTLEMAVAHGVTTFSSRMPNPRVIDNFAYLNRAGQMPIRFAALMEGHRKPGNAEARRQLYALTGNLTGVGNNYLWIHGVASELWDSDFPTACLGPDLEAPSQIKARELCQKPGDLYYDVIRSAMGAGWRIAGIHGMASEGVRTTLRLIESVMKEKELTVDDIRKRRIAIEHAEAIGAVPDVVEGLRKYGIIVSVDPARMYDREPDYIRDYGPLAEAFMEPVKTLMDNGIRVVGQLEGYRHIGPSWITLITRKNKEGKVVLPQEALDRVTVMKMWTVWAAEYVMKEKDLGSLEVGKLADFVVLDRDVVAIPIEQLNDVRPLLAVVGGKIAALQADYARKLNLESVGYQFAPDYKPWGPSGVFLKQ